MPGRSLSDEDRSASLSASFHRDNAMHEAVAQPEHVGILAAEVYFPNTYVRQEDLESYYGVLPGKYTAGLGQQGISYCGDREDAVSMAMTVLHQLLDFHGIPANRIGRLEAATESEIDGSKSFKSHLMQVLQDEDPEATDIEGCDCFHGCYSGTAAVQNAVNWIESRSWDGRLAIVVMSDVSVYQRGPARPCSGAGAVALLIGPDAPLAVERGLTGTYMSNGYDFYKPSGLYPTVDGPLSVCSYLEALDIVYDRYTARFAGMHGRPFALLTDADHVLFHAPYNKLVQKAFARLVYRDLCRADICAKGASVDDAAVAATNTAAAEKSSSSTRGAPVVAVPLGELAHPLSPAQMPKELDASLVAHSFAEYDRKVRPSTCIARLCGNMYTASLWSGLAQLVETTGTALQGRRIMLFSYGSGVAATMLSLIGRKVDGQFNLERLQNMSDMAMRLARRVPRCPEEFERAMAMAESRHCTAGYRPTCPAVEDLEMGTYYLDEVDTRHRRTYRRKVR